MPDDSVAELVTRARSGDPDAWGSLVTRFAPLVWGICRRYRLSDADAHDVAQTVWLRLLERISTLREPAALPGWLATTVAHECLHVLRVSDRDAFGELTDTDLARTADVPTPEDLVVIAERNDAVRAAIARLPEQCRKLFALLAQDPPLSYTEIGELLGRSVGGPRPCPVSWTRGPR
jgi:RNA polymerase sigma factor (sigma-70 family)